MASSTPPPHCSITSSSKPYQNHNYPHQKSLQNRSQNHNWTSQKVTLNPSTTAAAAAAPPKPKTPTFISPLPTPEKTHLGVNFCGKKSTRFVSKLHYNRPKASPHTKHSAIAEEALQQAIKFARSNEELEIMLHGFEGKLCGSDDYNYLLRELGNRGECWKAIDCYEFAVRREKKQSDKGKLSSSMISVLGRLGKVDLAQNVFDTAVSQGYGNTVYAYSALISAYGRSGYFDEAIKVFDSMKEKRLKPNLVTYNAVIDACGKGGLEFETVYEVYLEMLSNGITPDRITFNSLLAVCSRGGLWEQAMKFFYQMVDRGIEQDVFTYNTLLDAVCKAGRMELAIQIMAEMPGKKLMPNVVTYSTVIDGYAKCGELDEALSLFNEMKFMGIGLDRVCYNTLLSIYAKLGRFHEALNVCKEMDRAGIRKDVVTYNALLGGFGKQGKYNEVKKLFMQMKAEHVLPNLLTYSTLIDVYSKGGLHREAMEIFREFKQAGLRADVVLYSALIDSLCKNGHVESAVSLLDEMTKEGIRPNVVTYNTIIDAFGRSAAVAAAAGEDESKAGSVAVVPINDTSRSKVEVVECENRVMNILGQLAAEKSLIAKKINGDRQEILCILAVFHKMQELDIKPNVVTFSAILNACSRCNSLEDASMLLEELRGFDDRVYGVAHGLLTGYRDKVWMQAESLFDEVKQMDSSTASAFYNALTDVLWHFGQKQGAQLVVLEGKHRNVWANVWSESCLDLHLMSSGAARAMVHAWLLNIHANVFRGRELPKCLSIMTGWGKHSKVVGDGALKRAVEGLLMGMNSPFKLAKCNIGRFISEGTKVTTWLKESGTLKLLLLEDDITDPESTLSQLQLVTL